MIRLLRIIIVLGVLVSAAAAVITGGQFARAKRDASTQRAALARATEHAREIAALRTARPAWAARPRSDTPLAPRVSAVVASCGMPASALANLSPEAEATTGEGAAKISRQRATLTLSGVTLPQVGKFLDAWRAVEHDWTITSIDLTPQIGAKETPGRDLPLRAVIAIETVFMPEPVQSPHTRHAFFPGGKP